MEKRNIKAYLQFILTNNNTLQGYVQVKSSNFKISRLKKNVLRKVWRIKKIINNKAKIMPESLLVKNSEQKSQDYLTEKNSWLPETKPRE